MLSENELPLLMIGDVAEVRRRSKKYARRVLRAGTFVPDGELLAPVPLGKVDGIEVFSSGLPGANVARPVPCEDTLREVWMDYDVGADGQGYLTDEFALCRRLTLEGSGEFWFALVALLAWPVACPDLKPKAHRQFLAVALAGVLRW